MPAARRWKSVTLPLAFALGLSLEACSASSSTTSTTTTVRTVSACSLLTEQQAAALLGSSSVASFPSGDDYCAYGGTATSPTIVVRVTANPQPTCKNVQLCTDPNAVHVTVGGVDANWIPARSVTATDPTSDELTFIKDGKFVTIEIGSVADPQTTAENAMADIVRNF